MTFIRQHKFRSLYGLLTILLLVVGTAISIYSPYFLSPPWTHYTPFFYIILDELWLPVAMLGSLFFRRRARTGYAVIIIFVALGAASCAGIWRLWLLAGLGYLGDCQPTAPSAKGNVVYICNVTPIFDEHDYYLQIFEGQQGSPVMILKDLHGGRYYADPSD